MHPTGQGRNVLNGLLGGSEHHQGLVRARRCGHLHALDAGEVQVPQLQLIQPMHAQGHVAHRHQDGGPVDMHGEPSGRGDGEGVAGPPVQAGGVIPVGSTHMHLEGQTGDPLQGVPEDLGLEPALVRQHDVAVLRAAHRVSSSGVGPQRVGELPLVGPPELRGAQDLHHVPPPEPGLLPRVGDQHPDDLARNGMTHEHHTALMPGHTMASVGHGADLDLDQLRSGLS